MTLPTIPGLGALTRRCSLIVLASLLLAPTAFAQDGGDDPTIDPTSPAGTEYRLPVDRAREEARGGGSDDADAEGGQSPAPLFGEGVEPDDDSGTAAGAKGTGTSTTGSGKGDGGQAPPPAPPPPPPAGQQATVRAQAQPPDDGGALIAVGASALGLLLVGGLGGLLWRRRVSGG